MLEAALKTFALNLDFARRLVEDLDGAELCAQPAGHPTHGAWTLGHLAYSCQAVGEEIGLTHWFDEPTAALFRPGSKPTADASRYPAKADLLKLLADGAARVEAAITALGPAGMAKPLPDVRFRKTLPTVGHAVVYSCCGHAALHAGLLVAWRRAAGHRAVSAYFPGPPPSDREPLPARTSADSQMRPNRMENVRRLRLILPPAFFGLGGDHAERG